MITRKQSIEQFISYMNELTGTNYILADKKTSNLLKVITASKLFFELINYCAADFDYNRAKDIVLNGKPLPCENRKEMISFGFSLLAMFDSKEVDLLTFLGKYYQGNNFDRSYKMFCDEFLVPFKNCTVEVAREMDRMMTILENENDQMEDIAQGPEEDTEQLKMDIPSENIPVKYEHELNSSSEKAEPHKKYLTCYKDIQKIIISEKGKIIHNKSIKEGDKQDLNDLLERFRKCLFAGSKAEIKMTFISYKYAALSFKKLDSEVDDIERILKFCNVL